MLKMADALIGQSEVMSPKWYHCGTISVLLHGILLTLCNYWIPDSPVLEPLPQSASIIKAMPVIEAFDEGDADPSPEAVSANDNPFEEPDEPDIPHPNLNVNAPKDEAIVNAPIDAIVNAPIDDAIQNSTFLQAVERPILPELPVEQESADQTDEMAQEKNVDASSVAGESGADGLPKGESGNGHTLSIPQNSDSSGAAGTAINEHAGNHKRAPSVDETALWDVYKKKLNAHFKSHRHYPEMARRLKLTGTVIVSVEIKRNGDVMSVQLEQSSGIEILDEAAISSAKDASPAPAFPEGVVAQEQKVLIPYRYSIN